MEGEIAIGAHCDAGNILTIWGRNVPIGICDILREKINGYNKDKTSLGGIPIDWASGGGL